MTDNVINTYKYATITDDVITITDHLMSTGFPWKLSRQSTRRPQGSHTVDFTSKISYKQTTKCLNYDCATARNAADI